MEKIRLLTLVLFFILPGWMKSFAQRDHIPDAVPYQAIIRTASGQPVEEGTPVSLMVTVTGGLPAEGRVVYKELHETTALPGGLVTLHIGEGQSYNGKFGDINWAKGELWLEIAVRLSGEPGFKTMIATRFYPVPYALYARTAGRFAQPQRSVSDSAWTLTGNAGTTPAVNFIGTTDFEDFVFRTNNAERLRIKAQGLVGIGTVNPATNLEILGSFRAGDGSNYGQFNSDGDLWFKGGADYLVGANRYAFRYQINQNFGLFFNATNSRYEFKDATAQPVFYSHAVTGNGYFKGDVGIGTVNPLATLDVRGTALIGNGAAGQAQFLPDGDLTFTGSADYLVQGDRFAFRYASNQNYGLYFNASNGRYEFTDGTASRVFSVHANTGNTYIAGSLGIGTTTPASTLDVAGTLTVQAFRMPAGAVQGYMLVTDSLGNASWQPSPLNGVDNDWIIAGNRIYNANSGNVGIGTSNPQAKLHVADTNGVLFTGILGKGNIPAQGPGNRFMWYSRKAALRAGQAAGVEWDDANIGFNSVAFGFANLASGNNSAAFGSVNYASGSNAFAAGNFTTASGSASTSTGWITSAVGDFSIAMGMNTLAEGKASAAMGKAARAQGLASFAAGNGTRAIASNSFASGKNTRASGNSATALGINTVAQPYAAFVAGQYNIISGDTGNWVPTDPLFVIGNGTNPAARSNALTVLKNSYTGINTANPQEQLDVNGGIRIGNTMNALPGVLRFNGSDFEGYDGSAWRSLTSGSGGNQTLLFSGTLLSISGGNTVDLSPLVEDADADSTNELQDLLLAGNILQLTGSASQVDLTPYLDNTDNQQLSLSGNTLSITGGNSVVLPSAASPWQGNGNNIFYSGGNVGIGTSGPLYTLDVNGTMQVQGLAVFQSIAAYNANVNFTQKVGIGTFAPVEKLDIFGGNGRVQPGYAWLTSSDMRLKKNITTLEDVLEKITHLRGVRYDLADDPDFQPGKGKHIGFIAQEVEAVYPELVHTDAQGYKSVAYGEMTAVLLEAVKRQQQEIEWLKQQLALMREGNSTAGLPAGQGGDK